MSTTSRVGGGEVVEPRTGRRRRFHDAQVPLSRPARRRAAGRSSTAAAPGSVREDLLEPRRRGRTPVGWWRGGSLSPSAMGNSNSASGLPCASMINRSRTVRQRRKPVIEQPDRRRSVERPELTTLATRHDRRSTPSGCVARPENRHGYRPGDELPKPAPASSPGPAIRRSSTITRTVESTWHRDEPEDRARDHQPIGRLTPINPSATLSVWRYNGGSAASPSRRGCNT